MEIVNSLEEIKKADITKKSALALGYFDGIHRGHRAVIQDAVQQGISRGYTSTVFTMIQRPRDYFSGEQTPRLLTLPQKLSLLERLGVERVVLIDFESICDISAEDFVAEVLGKLLHTGYLSCGFNYHFGKGGTADGETMKKLGAACGIEVSAKERIEYGGQPVSSSRIRACVDEGDIVSANTMLGRAFSIEAPVTHGQKLGRQWGTPTANQQYPDGLILPPFGVYASYAVLDNEVQFGVTNIGVRPTVVRNSDTVLAETWFPDYRGNDFYLHTLDLHLLDRIRAERKFLDTEQLKEQIYRDASAARQIFSLRSSSFA